jgi:hypothetical protein
MSGYCWQVTKNLPGRGTIEPLAPLYGLPPAIAVALILGWLHGSLFFLLRGRRGRHLPFYVLATAVIAIIAQLTASALTTPTILSIGDCNVLIISASCWLGFMISRVFSRIAVSQTQP